MSQQQDEGRYSLKWSNEVAKTFRETYPRVVGLLYKRYGIDDGEVAVWISMRSQRWVRMKKIVKLTEKWLQEEEREHGEHPDPDAPLMLAIQHHGKSETLPKT